MIDAEHGGFQLDAADWAFYSEKVRKAQYAFDESQLKPYYELDHVLFDGVFYAANKLYGLTFKERHDLPVYEPDVRVFDVFDEDGTQLAIFIGDYYARPNKNGGAWMNAYVPQNGLTRRQAGHRQPPQHPEAAGRRADAADARRGHHRVPRVRPRAARHVLAREVPALRRHAGAARLRRVPVAVQRDVGDAIPSAQALREALQDRRADPAGAARQGAGGVEVRPGLRDDRVPVGRRCSTRPGTS